MKTGSIIVLVLAAIVFAAVGFTLGQFVNASVAIPGSADDPLVSQSFVQRYVNDRLSIMQGRIDELEAEIIRLTGTTIEGNQGNNIQEPGNNQPDPPEPPTPPAPTTVTVREGTAINVRSSASETASIITTVNGGTTLEYLSSQNDNQGRTWYRVRLADGREGWIAGWLASDPR